MLIKALVYKSTGSWYSVKTEDGQWFNARIKGVMKIEGLTSTNPVAVGDWVEVEPEGGTENTAVISTICDRDNYIARTSPHSRFQFHIVASNVHQSVMFATLREPRTSQGFIDRFLVSCEAYHVPAIVVYNKADVYRQKDLDKFEELAAMYQNCGYTVLLASMNTGQGVEELKQLLVNKTTLLSGHSGVGKSSFINVIFPQLKLRTKAVSGWSGKGMHTTTFAEMFDLPFGGRIIDTPGVREFGLVDIEKQELSHYFPEMRNLLQQCQFNNCMHINEPGCAVKEAVMAHALHPDRYFSYLGILDTMTDKNY